MSSPPSNGLLSGSMALIEGRRAFGRGPVVGEERSTTRAAVVARIARVKDTGGACPAAFGGQQPVQGLTWPVGWWSGRRESSRIASLEVQYCTHGLTCGLLISGSDSAGAVIPRCYPALALLSGTDVALGS